MMRMRAGWLALAAVATLSACAGEGGTPAPKETQFDLGTRRVQVIVPAGWEALDQGRQKRFRNGEREIVLQNLGPPPPPARGFDDLIDWGLATLEAGVGHDQGREVQSRRPVTINGREAMDIATWSRLDHSNPQRIFLVRDNSDLLALQTVGMAFEDTLAAFDAIRDSFHFVSGRQ